MKKIHSVILILVIICISIFMVPASALEARASDQITLYSIGVTPTSNTLNISFSVTATDTMDKLGCESIEVYEKSGDRWILSESKNEDDVGMSSYNTHAKRNSICCNGKLGVSFKVVVTIYAENSAGRDTRSKTCYVTGK